MMRTDVTVSDVTVDCIKYRELYLYTEEIVPFPLPEDYNVFMCQVNL